jgi:hypothetical protein
MLRWEKHGNRSWMTMIGVFAGFPTATVEELKSPYTTLGPEVILGKTPKWGFLGAMVNHGWGIGGSDAEPARVLTCSMLMHFDVMDAFATSTAGVPRRASVTAGQYFYV